MGIASFSGASSVIKPGVVTSSTRPSSPFVGQLIYETDTARLAAYNGSAWVTQNALQLVKTQTIGTAVSSVTVSDAFSATYENYLVTVSGGVGSTNQILNLTLGATATGYYQGGIRYLFDGTSTVMNINNGTAFQPGVASANTIDVNCTIFQPNAAKRTSFMSQTALTLGSGLGFQQITAGLVDNATQYTAFTITNGGGTLTGGIIRVYGYANS